VLGHVLWVGPQNAEQSRGLEQDLPVVLGP
jgi:hypothetical protein